MGPMPLIPNANQLKMTLSIANLLFLKKGSQSGLTKSTGHPSQKIQKKQ
jgi:hypothetical protein